MHQYKRIPRSNVDDTCLLRLNQASSDIKFYDEMRNACLCTVLEKGRHYLTATTHRILHVRYEATTESLDKISQVTS